MSFKKQLYQNFVCRIFYFVSVFLLNVVIARSYEAAQSGWINFISNNFALAITFGTLSLEVAVLYFGSATIIDKHKLATFSIIWSIFLSIIFYVVFSYMVSKSDSIASKGLLNFGASNYFIGIIFTNFFMNLFLIHKQYILPNVILGLLNFLLVFLIPDTSISIQVFDKQTFLFVYYFWFTLQGITLVVAYYFYIGKVKFVLPSFIELKKMFSYAAVAFLGNVSFFFLCKLDYWLVDRYRSEEELGNYIQAAKLGQTLLLFAMITATAIFVNAAAEKHSKKQVLQILKLSRLFLLFFIAIFLVFLFVGNFLFTTVFGASFYQMHTAFLALLPGLFFLSVVVLIGNYFGAINKSFLNVSSNMFGIVFIIVFDIVLLKRYGITVAALVSSIGYALTMLYALYCLHKTMPFTVKELCYFSKKDFDWLPKLLFKK